jgi:hypothetical protein
MEWRCNQHKLGDKRHNEYRKKYYRNLHYDPTTTRNSPGRTRMRAGSLPTSSPSAWMEIPTGPGNSATCVCQCVTRGWRRMLPSNSCRSEASTRGHVLVVMLAYMIVQSLAKDWVDFDLTVEEALDSLATLCTMYLTVGATTTCNQIPEPNDLNHRLLASTGVMALGA